MKPEELLFAKTHEWVAVATEAGQKVATVGLTKFAVEALTDLVFIELPKVGRQVAANESFCEVESVKAVSDVYAPVAGEVIAVNTALADDWIPSAKTPTTPAGSPKSKSPTNPISAPCLTTPRTRSNVRKRRTRNDQ